MSGALFYALNSPKIVVGHAGGAYSAPPDPLAGSRGKGGVREGRAGGEERERGREGGEGKEAGGREGGREGYIYLLLRRSSKQWTKSYSTTQHSTIITNQERNLYTQ